MKLFILIVSVIFLTGCASMVSKTTSEQAKFERAVGKNIELVYKNKECRVGLMKAILELRPVSVEAKQSIDKLIPLVKQDDEEFQKCYFAGYWYNLMGYLTRDLQEKVTPDILDLIGAVIP